MIVLIGAHGTGKTTLLNALKEARPDIYTSDGFGRPIKEAGQKLGMTGRQQQVVINSLSKHRWPNDVAQSNFACTRSIIDDWVYCMLFDMPDLGQDQLEIFRESEYRKAKYFYIPIEFPLEKDGIRYEDSELQQECDELMRQWIEQFELDAVTLTGTVEERLKTLLNNI